MQLNDEKEEMMAACRNMAVKLETMAAHFDTNPRARTFLRDWALTQHGAANAMAMVDLETDYPKS